MAGRLSLHNQEYGNQGSINPADPPDIGIYVGGVTTDADTHSVLLAASLTYENSDTTGYDEVQFYRAGVDVDGFPVVLGDPVGPAYRLPGIASLVQPYLTIIAVDPDPPACGTYTLCGILGDGVMEISATAIIAFTF
jgi:hypothetical protein